VRIALVSQATDLQQAAAPTWTVRGCCRAKGVDGGSRRCRRRGRGPERYTAEELDCVSGLRAILRSGVGTDAIDIDAATARGIWVTAMPGVNAGSVAEHALALTLALLHRVVVLDARVRAGQWRDGVRLRSLQGARFGVVGLGRIGQRPAQLAASCGAEVRGFDPVQRPPGIDTVARLDDLLAWVDVLSLHVPLTAETEHLISSRELGLLSEGALLVNTSRGGVVDQPALATALRGHLGGAALDVFGDEPVPRDDPLTTLDNTVLTPHVGSLDQLSVTLMTQRLVQQIEQLERGHAPEGAVNVPATVPWEAS
jgi:phosphoglycerate dehydrogenase-like enzyme